MTQRLWPALLVMAGIALALWVIVALIAQLEGWEPRLYTEGARLVRVFMRAGRFANE